MTQSSAYLPQLATLVDEVPKGSDWVHEMKFDGYRILAFIERGKVKLYSRNMKDWTVKLSLVEKEIRKLRLKDSILDGEVIAPDSRGLADFQNLQNAFKNKLDSTMVFKVFDILKFEKKDLRGSSLLERKKLLETIFKDLKSSQLQLTDYQKGDGAKLLQKMAKLGMEGIVSKQVTGHYQAGRSKAWLKIKCLHRQEFVIVGYSRPTGARKHFGSLILAAHNRDGHLQYVGRTGTGFDVDTLTSLKKKLDALEIKTKPKIADPFNEIHGVHEITWVKPKLVAQVKFAEWTNHQILRQSVFQGLREDKGFKSVSMDLDL